MLTLHTTKQFRKDLKRFKHSKRKPNKLWEVVEILLSQKTLSENYKPHALLGKWKGYLECHVEPDLLLVYSYTDNDTLTLVRVGSHSKLFR
jgi:mRNA interferase YafQ